MSTPINWKEVAEKWQFVADRNKAVLAALIQDYDEETGVIDVRPTPSCPSCTQGVTPDALNKGLCAYHQALELVAPPTPRPKLSTILE